jgi:hypothetical protein
MTNEAALRPEVILGIDFEAGLFFVSLRGIGARRACSVRTAIEPRFTGWVQRLSELPVFREILFFAPGKTDPLPIPTAKTTLSRRRADTTWRSTGLLLTE